MQCRWCGYSGVRPRVRAAITSTFVRSVGRSSVRSHSSYFHFQDDDDDDDVRGDRRRWRRKRRREKAGKIVSDKIDRVLTEMCISKMKRKGKKKESNNVGCVLNANSTSRWQTKEKLKASAFAAPKRIGKTHGKFMIPDDGSARLLLRLMMMKKEGNMYRSGIHRLSLFAQTHKHTPEQGRAEQKPTTRKKHDRNCLAFIIHYSLLLFLCVVGKRIFHATVADPNGLAEMAKNFHIPPIQHTHSHRAEAQCVHRERKERRKKSSEFATKETNRIKFKVKLRK